MNRAYSTLQIKTTEDSGGKRRFSGVASTPSTDRMGDIVEPKGAVFKLPIPLLWQHDAKQPIGWITAAKVTDKGIEVEGEVADVAEPGKLQDRLTEAWQTLKAKLVRGLSIGFNPIESVDIKGTWAQRFIKWEWLELSAVTIAANQDASILSIKSIDDALLAASGHGQSSSGRQLPGASGISGIRKDAFSPRSHPKGNDMKTLAELREASAQKTARLTELMEVRKAEDRRFTEDEATEFDALTEDVADLADDIRVKQFEAANSATARPVYGKSADEGSNSRGGLFFVRKQDPDDKFKGQSMTRVYMAKAAQFIAMKEGNPFNVEEFARKRWGIGHQNQLRYMKAAVAGGGTGSGEWGAELVASDTRYNGDFIEFLYSLTVFDRLPLRSVPARVHIKGQDGAATGYWRGESKAIPVSKPDFSDVELKPMSVGAIAICSKELILDSDPSAEMWIRDAIAKASSDRVDATFLSTSALSAGVSPAGILNGLSAGFSAGPTADNVRADIETLYSGFITAKNASGLYFVTTPSLAKSISLMRNTLGQREFEQLGAMGGMLEGDVCVTGDNVGAGDLILMKPSDIWKIGDSGIQMSMSDTAMVEQDGAPQGATDTPVAASATMVSLWQEESVGFKVTRRINFQKRRSTAVAYIGDAAYGYAGT